MFPEKFLEVLKRPGVVAIATQGQEGPHLVNTWNSYIQITEDQRLLIPAGFMRETEANVAQKNQVLLTVGSHEVQGNHGPGTGFLIKGSATFISSGAEFDAIKAKHVWARAALAVTVESIAQTL